MQIVSGMIDSPTVHFETPGKGVLESELNDFIEWFNDSREDPPVEYEKLFEKMTGKCLL